MYGALWRILPGPAWVRAVILVVLVAAVLTACALWVFPWVEHTFLQEAVTVEESG